MYTADTLHGYCKTLPSISQIVILTNHQNGKDTHLRQIKVHSPISHGEMNPCTPVITPRFNTADMLQFSIRWHYLTIQYCHRKNWRTVILDWAKVYCICIGSCCQQDWTFTHKSRLKAHGLIVLCAYRVKECSYKLMSFKARLYGSCHLLLLSPL